MHVCARVHAVDGCTSRVEEEEEEEEERTMGDFADDDLPEVPCGPLVAKIAPVRPDGKPVQVPDLGLHHGEGVGLAAQEEAVGLGRVRR